ncbi:major facilitator superfamily transporter [Diaporthe helianthi]|uniref:Major facilitator superfamily transporter n=1 Tax=Diaporthe helianthi TaxID=158607 RepID=A0A2P5I396_DIAHE|nr:major facilitator superfamily transporter [Diaporthe helianthi]
MAEPKCSLDNGRAPDLANDAKNNNNYNNNDDDDGNNDYHNPSSSNNAMPPPLFVVPSNVNQDRGRDAASSADDVETYPEGGLLAWLVVLGAWLGLVSSLGLMNTLATFQTYLTEHQLKDYDEGTVGWIFSIYTFVVFFGGLFIGPLFDKHGPRWLVLTGTVSIGASMMLFSISTELWHFILSFGVFCGLGCSLLFTPSLAAVGHFFQARRGLATGIASTGGSIGGIVFPLMLQSLFPRLGWGWSVRVLGFIVLGICCCANLLIRSRLPPAQGATARPDFNIFRNSAFTLTTLGIFLLEFALFIPLTYISSYARSKGFSEAFSFQILPILNAASAFGRALPGYWGDKIGPFNINLIMIIFSIISCLAIWLPAGSYIAGLILFAVTFGFASGSNISITPVCIGMLCKTQNYGRYYATCYTVVSFACLVGVPIGGNILTSNGGDYWGVIVFTGLVYLGALVSLYLAKVCKVGWKPWIIF